MNKVRPFTREHNKREIIRATKSLVKAMREGRTAEEAMVQLEGSYGTFIKDCVVYHLQNTL